MGGGAPADPARAAAREACPTAARVGLLRPGDARHGRCGRPGPGRGVDRCRRATPGGRKWWLGELARRANESEIDLRSLGVTPADVARVQALVDEGTLNDKLA